MSEQKTAALIVAAGMSSRMHAFKPLLTLGERTLLETAVQTLRSAGVEPVFVVVGNRADELERGLYTPHLIFVKNERYATSEMFDSIQMGLQSLKGCCDRFFVLPGDVPLFRRHSLVEMIKEMEKSGACVVAPTYLGKRGHPILLSAGCIDPILAHDGERGLKGALEKLPCLRTELELPDPGILMDADTPEEYASLVQYHATMEIPDSTLCHAILDWFEVDARIKAHCVKVAEVAQDYAARLLEAGYFVDCALVEAAALLHDVARREDEHAHVGANWLRDLGYPLVADVVETHMDLPAEAVHKLDERAVVYLADKTVVEDRRVTIDERIAYVAARYGGQSEVLNRIEERMNTAKEIERSIYKKTDTRKDERT